MRNRIVVYFLVITAICLFALLILAVKNRADEKHVVGLPDDNTVFPSISGSEKAENKKILSESDVRQEFLKSRHEQLAAMHSQSGGPGEQSQGESAETDDSSDLPRTKLSFEEGE